MPLHLVKLSVGSKSVDDLRRWQVAHGAARPPLHHTTRNFPRRADEILDGGSIYWVIDRILTVRQRIIDIREAARDDGTRCTHLVLDTGLVRVHPRLMKPFQGWRYLRAEDAPADLQAVVGDEALPHSLRLELASLALL